MVDAERLLSLLSRTTGRLRVLDGYAGAHPDGLVVAHLDHLDELRRFVSAMAQLLEEPTS